MRFDRGKSMTLHSAALTRRKAWSVHNSIGKISWCGTDHVQMNANLSSHVIVSRAYIRIVMMDVYKRKKEQYDHHTELVVGVDKVCRSMKR